MKIIVGFNFGGKETFECDDHSIDYDRGFLEIKSGGDFIGMIMLETIKYWKVEETKNESKSAN